MMIHRLLLAGLSLVVSAQAWAYGDAGCGLGSLIWTKNSFTSQMLAVSTNRFSGTQTSGITSGTSGCKRKGLIYKENQTDVFVASNLGSLKDEVARGSGENLQALSYLMGCPASAQGQFATTLQANYSELLAQPDVSAPALVGRIRHTIGQDQHLAGLCQGV